jgi:hypothetical protein
MLSLPIFGLVFGFVLGPVIRERIRLRHEVGRFADFPPFPLLYVSWL